MGRKPYASEADYVVVGSGSSGAAIAGRLAQSGASVIVLEAGKSDEQFLVKKPGMIGPMHAEPKLKARVDWGLYSTPQKHLLDRRMPVPRGKVVGGSSSINGMVYVRGNRANYDAWAAEGCTGWSADEVNAAYRRMEDFEDGANDYRGAGGPIKVTRNGFPQEGSLQFLDATSQALGVPVVDDYNAASQEGVSRMQQNTAHGLRYSASRGYLHHLDVPTLELQTEVLARRVVVEGGRATGVEVTDVGRGGGTRTVRAGKEAILSAGFVGSAQLLMLSGIGHAQHLRDHGIDVGDIESERIACLVVFRRGHKRVVRAGNPQLELAQLEVEVGVNHLTAHLGDVDDACAEHVTVELDRPGGIRQCEEGGQ